MPAVAPLRRRPALVAAAALIGIAAVATSAGPAIAAHPSHRHHGNSAVRATAGSRTTHGRRATAGKRAGHLPKPITVTHPVKKPIGKAVPGVPATTTSSAAPVAGGSGAAISSSGSACGGEQPAGNWQCTFDDEFNGTSLDRSTWLVQTTAASGWHGGDACAVDDPSTVSESGGYLHLSVVDTGAPFTCHDPQGDFTTRYAEGTVTTNQGFGQAYGRWEFRARFPDSTVAGLQSALWLWPQDDTKYGNGDYPGSGEIDVAENYSAYSNVAVPFIHYIPASSDPDVTNDNCTIAPGQFNTYTLVWTTSTLTIQINGATCTVDDWQPSGMAKPAPFDSPFMILLTQELGIGNNAFDASNPPPLPATTDIDYVRVWKQTS